MDGREEGGGGKKGEEGRKVEEDVQKNLIELMACGWLDETQRGIFNLTCVVVAFVVAVGTRSASL